MDCAESLLEQNGFVRAREVIAIVAGTRTKSGSTNFMRLHVMGDSRLEGARFQFTRDPEPQAASKTKSSWSASPVPTSDFHRRIRRRFQIHKLIKNATLVESGILPS